MRYLGYAALSLAVGALVNGPLVWMAWRCGAYGSRKKRPICECGNPNCIKGQR